MKWHYFMEALPIYYTGQLKIIFRNNIAKPFGITPGSMNVANVKLAKTKNVITPCTAGTHGCVDTKYWRHLKHHINNTHIIFGISSNLPYI